MATREQLEQALRNAHAAGDTGAAQRFAGAIKAGQFDPPAGRATQAVQGAREQATNERGSIFDVMGQGATFGFADEITAGINATIGGFDPTFEGTTWGERYKNLRDISRENLSQYREREPEAAFAGELAGGLLTGGAGAARFGAAKTGESALRTIGRVAGTAGTEGAIYGAGQSEAEDLEGLSRDMAMGGATGAVGGGALAGAFRGARGALKTAVQPSGATPHLQAVKELVKEGVPLSTGQRAGSDRLKALETTLGQSVLGGTMSDLWDAQRQRLQSTLMRKAGFADEFIPEGLVTREALDATQERFSQRYAEALGNKRVRLDSDDFLGSLGDIEAKHGQFLDAQQRGQVGQIVENFLELGATGKPLTGERYQVIRSELGRVRRSMKTNNPMMADLYRDLTGALDDAFMAGVPAATGKAKRAIDQQYARFSQVRNIYNRGGGQSLESGVLPLASLNRAAKKNASDKEWGKLVASASRVLPDSTPNSGTASRLMGLEQLAAGGLHLTTAGVPFMAQQALARGKGAGLAGAVGPQALSRLDRLAGGLTGGTLGGYYSATGGNPDDVAP